MDPKDSSNDSEIFDEHAVVFEVTDVLDLHTFAPKDVPELVRDYLDLAQERGYQNVRIIHGKGIGVQRRIVRAILDKDPRVVSYGDPEGFSGGWGATSVELRHESSS